MHVIAAKAVALKEALKPEFKIYQKQVVKNAKALASHLQSLGYRIVSGGTDTHLLLVDLLNKKISGRDAALALYKANITVNKNLIPFDEKGPNLASGIRLGTPAVTTRGMKEAEMRRIAELMDAVSPLAVLGRGYSITLGKIDRKVIKDSHELTVGEEIEVIFDRGSLEAEVTRTKHRK